MPPPKRPILAFAALLVCGFPAFAQQSWDSLHGLRSGDRIKVEDSSGRRLKGYFTAFSANSLSFQTSNGAVSVERERVRKVQLRSGARRIRNLIIGAAVGLAVGVAIDQSLGAYMRNEGTDSDAARAVTYIAPISIFGCVAGAFPAYRTVYRVR